MAPWPILSIVTFLPLLGAVLIMALPETEAGIRNIRWTALWTSLITFILSLFILVYFDPKVPGFQLIERAEWIPGTGIIYQKGVDGISIWFVLVSTLLTPICVISTWEAIHNRVKEFMVALLILETMMVGVFTALDLILLYVFFEGVLIPMFLIIGVWGGQRRVYSAFKFFLYTLLGSVLMLLAILAMYLKTGTTDLLVMLRSPFDRELQIWLWLAYFASFAVKMPMWPVHTWLPDAHVEAPTAGSVMLAAVLLKMGGYGFIRFSVQMLPLASEYFAPFMFALSIVAIIYTSLVALAQTDMKKLIAYSSVAHMGFVTLGIFTFTERGVEGSVFQMLSHAVVSGALFLCVGVVYDRLHTREIARYGGMARTMPNYALVFMIFTLASVGLPGTSGFVGEFLSLTAAFEVNRWAAFLATTGIILGAAYMLVLYRKLFFGEIIKDDVRAMPDLNWREWAVFAPLVALTIWMGVYPSTFKDLIDPAAAQLVAQQQQAMGHPARMATTPAPVVPAAVLEVRR
ncbi:MAG TPA: NADH-quinone oxidoreductase subunit M [Alphaproteobacteria bacterium]|nr:NADH-quinone oxidoreductase subunit M [Alphaproteobacteria bacterium]